jgi:hypothetical protein
LRELGLGIRLGDNFVLPGFDEDDGRDQDDQYRYEEGYNDWLDGRVTYALLGGRVACCRLLLAHGWLDAEAVVWG